jgi:hypothetical protein
MLWVRDQLQWKGMVMVNLLQLVPNKIIYLNKFGKHLNISDFFENRYYLILFTTIKFP